jgi:hypothetical protein
MNLSFDYFFYQFIATTVEMFTMLTLVLYALTPKKDADVIDQNAYNIAYLTYQGGLFLSIILSRVFIIRNLPMFPGFQILLMLSIIFINFLSKYNFKYSSLIKRPKCFDVCLHHDKLPDRNDWWRQCDHFIHNVLRVKENPAGSERLVLSNYCSGLYLFHVEFFILWFFV